MIRIKLFLTAHFHVQFVKIKLALLSDGFKRIVQAAFFKSVSTSRETFFQFF